MSRTTTLCRRRWARRGRGLGDFVFGFLLAGLSHVLVGFYELSRWMCGRRRATSSRRNRRAVAPANGSVQGEANRLTAIEGVACSTTFIPIAEKPDVRFSDVARRMVLPLQHPEKARVLVGVRRGGGLPPLSLLDPPATPVPLESPGKDVMANRIASQFRQRGIDATCVGVDVATRMTTFRFRLAEGGYDQVTKADDLLCRMIAMTTETSGISIQAPIPDSVDIAVHLPRKGVTEPVRLAPFVDVARRSAYRVPLCLGDDYLGRPCVVDLATECHQLVAGQTGSGKSVFLSSAVLTLTMATTPESVRLVLIDGKGLDLTVFDPLPHNACPVITEPSQAARALECLNGEMDRRRQFIRQESAQDIWTLNERLSEQHAALPAWVLMIDEFQTILSERNADRLLQRLAQQGRACGIFVILATQRPSVDILQGSTKTNIPGRVCFRLPSQVDSRVVLDQGGAEELAQPGDLLTVQSSTGRLVRLQCPLPSRGEIQRVREYFDSDQPSCPMEPVEAIGDAGAGRTHQHPVGRVVAPRGQPG